MNNYWERFSSSVDRWGDRPAIVLQRRESIDQLDYRALAEQAEAFAARLAGVGVAPGECCAILGENSPAWCAAYLGILRLGAVVVPLDRTYSAAQVEKLVSDSGAKAIFASALCRPIAEAARRSSARPLQLLDLAAQQDDASRTRAGPSPPACPARPSDPAVLLYTSGTTADPKGVVLTHENLLVSVDGMLAAVPVSERDCSLGALPLFHILSQISILLLPFAIGACVVMLEDVNAGEVLRAMRERGITVLCSVPQFFYLIHERIAGEIAGRNPLQRGIIRLLIAASGFARDRLNVNPGAVIFRKIHAMCGPHVRYFVSAGAAFDPRVARALHRLGFDILQAYGLTESTGAATITPPHANRIGTVGVPLAGVRVAVLAPDGASRERGQEGEVALRGATLTPGYYRRADATAEAFRNGWFWTGDLGFLDEDGYLHITGRSKDVIILGSGKNVFPEEIERQLERSRFIKEVCVVGRQRQGRALSETLHAVVVPDMTALRENRIVNTRRCIRHEIETLSTQLPSHKRVMSFDLVQEDLPRTTTRKIKRHVVQRGLAEAVSAEPQAPRAVREWSPEDRVWAESPAVAAVLSRIEAQAPGLHPDDSLELDLGLDSLGRVELIVAVEQALGAKLEESANTDCYTVRDLANAALRAVPAETGAGGIVPAPTAGWAKIFAEDVPARNGNAPPRGAGPGLDAARFCVLKAIGFLARRLVRFEVEGREHLPGRGAFILCVNHQSYLDGFLLLSAIPYRLVRRLILLGKPQYFAHGIAAWLSPRLNIAAVDADANLIQAMRISARVLREGRALMLFPEGERTIDGEIRPLRRGAALLSCHLGVPIVPVVIDGPYEIWPRGRGLQRRAPVSLRVLPPIAPAPPCSHADDAPAFERRTVALTEDLQRRMESALADLRSRCRAGGSGR
jgi:long-chain acyl-CoA synthetase